MLGLCRWVAAPWRAEGVRSSGQGPWQKTNHARDGPARFKLPVRLRADRTVGQAESLGSAYYKNPNKLVCHFAYSQGGTVTPIRNSPVSIVALRMRITGYCTRELSGQRRLIRPAISQASGMTKE